jgi:hypothetical protein
VELVAFDNEATPVDRLAVGARAQQKAKKIVWRRADRVLGNADNGRNFATNIFKTWLTNARRRFSNSETK